MSSEWSLTEIVISRLGTPYEPIDLAGVLVIAGFVIAFLVYGLAEAGVGIIIARWVSRLGREPPDDPPEKD